MLINKHHYVCILSIWLICLFENLYARRSFEVNDIEFIEDSNHEFDLLIFTQRWPITGCMEWMEERKDNVCVLPSQKDIWTIHGIWPTRFGSIGPAFCNKSAKFDVNTLQPYVEQLEQFWLNIEKGTPRASLWRHEWLKHGTCAMVLNELDNENKYFGQGLAWLQQYTMSSLLAKSNVLPNNNYTVVDIQMAIKRVLNRNPSIHCVEEKQTGDIYLSEIRICFSKTLELVDCDGVSWKQKQFFATGDSVITNCDLNRPIHYPSVVPKYLLDQTGADTTSLTWRFPWVNLYKLIQMIKWFTL